MTQLTAATDRLVAHLDHGECYAENYRDEDFGPAIVAVIRAARAVRDALDSLDEVIPGSVYEDRHAASPPCTFHRAHGEICGKPESDPIHPGPNERMGGGRHVYRSERAS
jgi:hypothetical protein